MIYVSDGNACFEFGSIALGEERSGHINLNLPHIEGIYAEWQVTVREITVRDIVVRGKNWSDFFVFTLPAGAAQSLFNGIRKEAIFYGKAASHELRLNLSALYESKAEPTEAEYKTWKAAVIEELKNTEDACVREFERIKGLKEGVAALP